VLFEPSRCFVFRLVFLWSNSQPSPVTGKLKIAEHYLLSAPPAQLDEVQRDVSVLLKPAAFDEAGLLAARKLYNLNNNVCVKVADGALPIVLCAEGALDDGRHLDTFRRVAVAVDHTAGTIAPGPPLDASSAPAFDPALEPLRAGALDALRAYATSHYNPGGAGGLPWARGVEVFSQDGGLVIVTSSTVRRAHEPPAPSTLVFYPGPLSTLPPCSHRLLAPVLT
jgi:hypothetical protein